MFEEEVMPHKKKAKKNTPAKSDHKHEFKPCILTFNEPKYDRRLGFVPTPVEHFSSYCPVCGKIGSQDHQRWWKWESWKGTRAGRSVYTDEAKRELDPETRTLPTFHIDSMFDKFVGLEEL